MNNRKISKRGGGTQGFIRYVGNRNKNEAVFSVFIP